MTISKSNIVGVRLQENYECTQWPLSCDLTALPLGWLYDIQVHLKQDSCQCVEDGIFSRKASFEVIVPLNVEWHKREHVHVKNILNASQSTSTSDDIGELIPQFQIGPSGELFPVSGV